MIKVGINGFGRIGRFVFRAAHVILIKLEYIIGTSLNIAVRSFA